LVLKEWRRQKAGATGFPLKREKDRATFLEKAKGKDRQQSAGKGRGAGPGNSA